MPSITFTLADPVRDFAALLDINIEYMAWNSSEIEKAFGLSVADAVGMPVPEYVASVIDKVCGALPPRGSFYLVDDGGAIAGMGGLRYVRPGVCEFKRIYVRPKHRGKHLGKTILERLLDDAAAFGFQRIVLDSGPYMHTAHRLYRAAGFIDREPYSETEVPAALHRGWLFMERQV